MDQPKGAGTSGIAPTSMQKKKQVKAWIATTLNQDKAREDLQEATARAKDSARDHSTCHSRITHDVWVTLLKWTLASSRATLARSSGADPLLHNIARSSEAH